MSDSDVHRPSASSAESFDTSYSSSKKKWKLLVLFSPTKESHVHQTKIWTKADKDGSSTAVFRSRLEQKSPVTECLVCCVCVLFFFFYEEIYGKNG